MRKIQQILENPLYRETLQQTKVLERDRIFCRHDMQHNLDVARIAQIINLQEELQLDKELIYAAALLHDIGRGEEYLHGIAHEEAGCRLAEEILTKTDFSQEEIAWILDAVRSHRGTEVEDHPHTLRGLLQKADKLSRQCYDCEAIRECFWPDSKKNRTIQY